MTIPDQITALLAADPACNGRVTVGCSHRIVVVGPWGHQLAHPRNCPVCRQGAIERGGFGAGEG